MMCGKIYIQRREEDNTKMGAGVEKGERDLLLRYL